MVYDCFFSMEEFTEIKKTELLGEDHDGACLSALTKHAGYNVNPTVNGPDGEEVDYETYLSITPDDEIVSELEMALCKANFSEY